MFNSYLPQPCGTCVCVVVVVVGGADGCLLVLTSSLMHEGIWMMLELWMLKVRWGAFSGYTHKPWSSLALGKTPILHALLF